MRALELVGKRLGKLLVIEKIITKAKKKNIKWKAICDCGEMCEGYGYLLKKRGQCEKCRKGKFYKELRHLANGTVEIKIDSRKYGLKSVFVDKNDLNKTLGYWWCIIEHHGNYYASSWCRKNSNGRRKGGRLHQFILGFPGGIIDHVDGNGLNNTRVNLRLVNSSQNATNARITKRNSTGFKGVTYVAKKGLYKVQLKKDNKLVYFKMFKNKLIAAKNYNDAAIKHHGKYAVLNVFTKGQLREIENPPIETRRIGRNNITGYIGVSILKNKNLQKPYVATIYEGGKNNYLGSFKTAKEAAITYNKAAKKYKGRNASLNIIK